MASTAKTPEEYIEELPLERKEVFGKLRKVITSNLPKGFMECMNYGMIGYVVPHSIYPKGYHCNPKLPLPFMSIASQKNYIVLHHLGLYANSELLDWFKSEYSQKMAFKLDLGKGCVRFKKEEQIPYDLIKELVKKITVEKFITTYENAFRNKD